MIENFEHGMCTFAPQNYFLEFYKFYKSRFSGTTFVLVEKHILLFYGLFKNSISLTFIRVKRKKTLNGAICTGADVADALGDPTLDA